MNVRRGDTGSKSTILNVTGGFKDERPSWFRSDRLRQEDGSWYFRTREGSVEGPYETRTNAESQLATYIQLKVTDPDTSGGPDTAR